jgi:hypothetical protein
LDQKSCGRTRIFHRSANFGICWVAAKFWAACGELKGYAHRGFKLVHLPSVFCCVSLANFGARQEASRPQLAKICERAATLFFSHPDFNRRLWNFTKSTELELFQDLIRVAGYTAGSDFH